jgi:holo-[acyl-carrier protein] synthase
VIVGVGIDVVDIARFTRVMRRSPRLRERLFTPAERDLPMMSLAARFAAKEAVAKALGAPAGLRWQDVTVPRRPHTPPLLEVTGTVADRAAELGVARFHLSLSHDGGIATAMVIAEDDPGDASRATSRRGGPDA